MGKVDTVRMRGPAGEVVVNASDMESYKGRGYEAVAPVSGESIAVASPPPPVEDDDDLDEDEDDEDEDDEE